MINIFSAKDILFFLCRQSLLCLLVGSILLGLAQTLGLIGAHTVLIVIAASGTLSGTLCALGIVTIVVGRAGSGRRRERRPPCALPPCSAVGRTVHADTTCREYGSFGFTLLGTPQRPELCEYRLGDGCAFGLTIDG